MKKIYDILIKINDIFSRRIIEDNINKLHVNLKKMKNKHFWMDETFYYNGI